MVQAEGLYHAVEQGAEAWLRDGAAAMADWSADLDAVTCRQTWLQGADCSIISAHQVADHMAHRPGVEFHVIEKSGTAILHTETALICRHLARLA